MFIYVRINVSLAAGNGTDVCSKFSPDSHFWIKADACDVNPGVQESMNHEWAGDVDLNDGQAEYEVYVSLVLRLKQPCLF